MHVKTDSEVTSLAPSSPPRSPRRPIYYVMSPSQPDPEKMSLGGSSPGASPLHHHHHHPPRHHRYMSSPIHHSRESSTSRFSASLKNGPWRKIPQHRLLPGASPSNVDGDEDEEEEDKRPGPACYAALFVVGFVLLFSLFSLILWGASQAYKPELTIKSLVFESYNIQAGMDLTGVPTKMLSINSTVRIAFRNPATFFGVHVSSTPLELYFYDLQVASGHMQEFYAVRKSSHLVTVVVEGRQVPLYGGGSGLTSRAESGDPAVAPLNLTFVVRARAHVLGKLVRSKFYRRVRCDLILRESRLGKAMKVQDLRRGCQYHD